MGSAILPYKVNGFCATQVITGFRETEKSHWKNEICQSVIRRLHLVLYHYLVSSTLPLVHILDLAEDG